MDCGTIRRVTSRVTDERLVINRRALKRACARAAEASLARGGVYDLRGSALVIWGKPRPALPPTPAGDPIGLISWDWGVPTPAFATITRIEAADGHTRESILAHLHRLLEPTRGALAPGDEYL